MPLSGGWTSFAEPGVTFVVVVLLGGSGTISLITRDEAKEVGARNDEQERFPEFHRNEIFRRAG